MTSRGRGSWVQIPPVFLPVWDLRASLSLFYPTSKMGISLSRPFLRHWRLNAPKPGFLDVCPVGPHGGLSVPEPAQPWVARRLGSLLSSNAEKALVPSSWHAFSFLSRGPVASMLPSGFCQRKLIHSKVAEN